MAITEKRSRNQRRGLRYPADLIDKGWALAEGRRRRSMDAPNTPGPCEGREREMRVPKVAQHRAGCPPITSSLDATRSAAPAIPSPVHGH